MLLGEEEIFWRESRKEKKKTNINCLFNPQIRHVQLILVDIKFCSEHVWKRQEVKYHSGTRKERKMEDTALF